MKEILEQSTLQLSSSRKALLWALVGLGVVMFIAGLAMGDAERTWQAFLINALYWGGMSIAGVMMSVVWQVTDARWGRPFKRIAESYAGFIPVTFVALIMVLFGASHLYEWVEKPMHVKEGYLNLGFFSVRNIIGMLILFGMIRIYLKNSLMPDMAEARKLIPSWGGTFAERLLKNYGDHETEKVRLEQKQRRLAPMLGIVYAIVISMIAFDYVMSLDQEWFSTLFGVYFFVGNLYTALAFMLIVVSLNRDKPGLAEYMTINRYHDLAKFTFAIAMLYTYMVFTQYLVIWYSNLPEEAPYLVDRSIADTPWRPLFWTLVVVLFIFPFLSLMAKTVCRKPKVVAVIALVLMIGQWWAHYLLVVPSIQVRHHEQHFIFGLHEILITAGFAGAFLLSFFWLQSKVPALPISDKHLCKTYHGH